MGGADFVQWHGDYLMLHKMERPRAPGWMDFGPGPGGPGGDYLPSP